MQKRNELANGVKQYAKELGFLECAIIPAGVLTEEEEHFNSWLKAEMHGEMGYMARNVEKRLDISLLVENAKTVVVTLLNYFPENTQTDPEAPVLSKYAYGTDYHFIIKDKLRKLLDYIRENFGDCNARTFTDSAPVLERAWARRAGLGWVGKNSNLISVEHGSFFFIGELILDIELPYDKPRIIADHCCTCTRCIDACPTKAIVADKVVDARLCISYQTIELKGDLDENLKGKFENRVFGCDICQDVCPWNLKSEPHNEDAFHPHPKLLNLTKTEWHSMERPLFNELFRNSAVKRAGYSGVKRNLAFLEEPEE